MRLIDADALLDWFDDQSDVIATTDVQALIDNWPTVSCGECNAYAEIAELTEMVTATGEVFWTHGWRKRAEQAEAAKLRSIEAHAKTVERLEQAEAEVAHWKERFYLADGLKNEAEAEVAALRSQVEAACASPAGCPEQAKVAHLTEEARKTAVRFDTVFEQRNKAEAELLAIAEADAIIPLNEEQAEAFKALSESIKNEQRLEAELAHAIEARDKSEAWAVAECKVRGEAEAQLDALLEANANNGLELMDEVGKRKQAEAELAKAPTWPTVEALQEQLKASEAKFQRCLKSENAARSALARSEAEVARLNKLDTTYHHD